MSPKEYIGKYLYIKTKDKKVIPLPMNPIQAEYWREKTNRDIILKPRQLSFTTLAVKLLEKSLELNPELKSVQKRLELAKEKHLKDSLKDYIEFTNLSFKFKKNFTEVLGKVKNLSDKKYTLILRLFFMIKMRR